MLGATPEYSLVLLGLCKDTEHHKWHTTAESQITESKMVKVQWQVTQVTADDHLHLPTGVCMGTHGLQHTSHPSAELILINDTWSQ